MKKWLSVTASAVLMFSVVGCDSNNDSNAKHSKPLDISIIHVNDTHSHLSSETYSLSFDGVKTYTEIGGYSRVVSKIKELQSSKTNPLTLNAGDTFQGTLYYSLFKGEADIPILNQTTTKIS